MKQRIWVLLLMAVLLMASAACAESEIWYIQASTSDRVHLREEPDGEARSLGLYFQGTEVERYGLYFNTDWVYVRIGAAEGYVHRDCLSSRQPEPLQPVYCVNNLQSSWVHLRAEPTTASESLGQYDNGTAVMLLGETADHWCYVQAGNLTGYMMSSMLSPMQEEMQTSRLTEIVGRTSDGQYIHAYQAEENDQILYFSAMIEELNMLYEDVNFDGHTDLVIFTFMGASNAYCEFFIWVNGQYVMAEHPGFDYGLCNYQLHPEKQILSTHANNGSAGAEHETCLFRWEGTKLRLIRQSIGENRTEHTFVNGVSTRTTYTGELKITIRDYTSDPYEGDILYEKTTDLNEQTGREIEKAYQLLWEGL